MAPTQDSLSYTPATHPLDLALDSAAILGDPPSGRFHLPPDAFHAAADPLKLPPAVHLTQHIPERFAAFIVQRP